MRTNSFRFFFLFNMILLIASCSVKDNRELLSFFFDGVEEAGSSAEDANNPALTADTSGSVSGIHELSEFPSIFYHEVYKEKQCDNCHDLSKGNDLTDSQPALCYNCHENYSEKFEFVHAPVDGGDCTECHLPHSSKFPKLLKSDLRRLCFNCHDQTDLLSGETHDGIEETPCTDCHNPHGGDNDKLL